MELMIELPARGGLQYELQKVSGDRITIGRAYDNDIILNDPHVCAHHAVIEISGDSISIQDLGSVNGTYSNNRETLKGTTTVNSGDKFYLGKSRIRIYRTDHPVPPSIRLNWVEKLASLTGRPLWASAFGLLTLVMSFYLQYTGELSEFHVGRELLASVGVLLLIALWPAGWALFARYKKHEPHYLAQLSATLVFVILLTLFSKLENWLAYHNGSSLLLEASMLIILALLVFVLTWYHLHLSIFMNSRKRWFYSVGLTLFLASIVYVGHSIDSESFNGRPGYTSTIFPPSLSFYSTQTVEELMVDVDATFERAREEAGHKTREKSQ